MAIKRTELPFEGHFVQLPNAWMRDKRLSRRARGLLAELMTHKVGWNINQSSLQEAGPEGREALSSAVKELRECGYLTIQQGRADSTQKFGEVEYHITDPHLEPVHGFPVERQNRTTVKPSSGKPAPKKTISKEHHSSEDETAKSIVQDKPAQRLETEFNEWWLHCWRKQAKPDAFKAFKAARKTTDLSVLIAGAQAYKLLNIGQDKSHLKMPAGWLRDRRWEDEQVPYVPSDAGGTVTPIRRPSAQFEECPLHPNYPRGTLRNPCDACKRDEQADQNAREGRSF